MTVEFAQQRRLGFAALALAGLLIAAGPQLLSGCSRRASEGTGATSAADTLGNGVPLPLLPELTSWVRVWRHAIPDFAPDSLTQSGSASFKFDYAWAGARRTADGVRTRALVDVLSPDSARSLDFDMYLDFDREGSGQILLEREPDSAPVLADFKSDTLWRVAFCGTPCFYDGAYWVDTDRFALTGAMQTSEQADGPWRAFLEVYDLQSRRLARWLGPTVDAQQFARYRAASDSSLAERLERAGFRTAEDSTTRARVNLANP
jgi:hypothetical protein